MWDSDKYHSSSNGCVRSNHYCQPGITIGSLPGWYITGTDSNSIGWYADITFSMVLEYN